MRFNISLLGIGIVSIAIFAALFFGLASSVLPWWLMLLVVAPFLLVTIGWRWPLFAVMGTVLAVFGVVPLPHIKLVDVTVFSFIVFICLLFPQTVLPTIKKYKALWVLLAFFIFSVVLSYVYGKYYRNNPDAYAYSETSGLLYWCTLFPAAIIARDAKSSKYMLNALIFVAVVLCLFSIAQSITGQRLLLFSSNNSVAELTSDQGGIAGLSRSVVPGTPLVIFSYFLALGHLLRANSRKFLWGFVFAVTAFTLLVSFGRTTWAVTAVASIILAMVSGKKASVRMVIYSIPIVTFIVILASIFAPEVLSGIYNRILSVGSEGGSTSSLGWRITENAFAKPLIASHPILGLGLGAEYKPRLVDMRVFSEQTHYIHNGYFFILLKMGWFGMLAYMSMLGYIIYRCFDKLNISPEQEAIRKALGMLIPATLALNVTEPQLIFAPTIVTITMLTPIILQSRWMQTASPVHARKPPK